MHISSDAIINGKISTKFGKYGSQFSPNGMPTYSIPLKISNAPEKTICFALFLEDLDAIPVCGYSWIHWVAANIPKSGEVTEIPENISICANFVQGVNSWHGKIAQFNKKEATGYGGMSPPDKPHSYDLTIFALDTQLDLQNGFYANELFHAMSGHVLASAKLTGVYDN